MQDQLIERLQNKDKSAVDTLYDQYGSALFGVIVRIVQSRELAEQVLQDTFIKIWRNGSSYDPSKGRLFTWMLNIARNTAIDATRTAYFQAARKTQTSDVLVSYSSGDTLNTDHVGLREVVERLDEKYRLLIDLIYFQGYTQEEAAEAVEIPLGTVKTRLRYAISELRKIFGHAAAFLLLCSLDAFWS